MNKFSYLHERLRQEGIDALLISDSSNRRYLSGFTGTNGYLLITEHERILITDFRYREQAVQQAKGFEIIIGESQLTKVLSELTVKRGIRRLGIEKEDITLYKYEELSKNCLQTELVPLNNPCSYLRMLKTEEELVFLQKAVEIADKAFLHVVNFVNEGQTEKEVAQELEFFMRRLGAEGTAFTTIVASGERSALPHGVASEKMIKRGDFVTLDFGALYEGYHSDMTRTLIIGNPTSKQKDVYNLVLEAQETAIDGIRPGMTASQADALARNIIMRYGYGQYFGHGLGHGVGLEIHEGPRLSPQGTTILEPGMVVTVEPGVYISGWGGVRIEDVIQITADGCRILTSSSKKISNMII